MPLRFARLGVTRPVIVQAARATVAAVSSMLLARMLGLPEFYWAPISAIVILLSPIDPKTLAWQRFVGTALGAAIGALVATYFPSTWIVYGSGIFVCGIASAMFRIGSAYRFTAITFTIVLLVVHTRSPSVVALHRFVEVSVGIAVALAVALVWPAPAGR